MFGILPVPQRTKCLSDIQGTKPNRASAGGLILTTTKGVAHLVVVPGQGWKAPSIRSPVRRRQLLRVAPSR